MGAGLTLLLVEDDPDDARVVERLLSQYRASHASPDESPEIDVASVERVERLDDALDHVDDCPVDLVILDLGLPDSSGTDTVDALADHAPGVPIVVLTGRTDAGVEAIRRGAQDYLVKGTITAELLARTLRYAVERERVAAQLRDRNHRLAMANEIVRTDLQDDLRVIVGMGDQLRERVDSEDADPVESLLDASRDALDLATTAGDLTEVLSGDRSVERSPVDLESVLEPGLARLRDRPDVALTVEWHVSDGTPPTVAGTPMLETAFDQLLSNAATHTDLETAAVDVTVDATDDRVSVAIADDGLGLSSAQKAAVVGDADRPDRAGLGAGLYLVRTVLRSVDADVDVTDNAPRGTAVTVTLDRAGPER